MKRFILLPALLFCIFTPALLHALYRESTHSANASQTSLSLKAADSTQEGLVLSHDNDVVLLPLGNVSVLDNEKIVQTLSLTNTTDKTLKIERCYNSCGCISAHFRRLTSSTETKASNDSKNQSELLDLPVEIQPGSKLQFIMTLDLRMLSPGAFQKSLQLFTSVEGSKPSEVPTFCLRAQGTVAAPVTFDPPTLSFSELQAGKSKTLDLVVTPDPRLSATGTPPPIQAQTSLRALGSELKAETTGAPGSKAGTFRYRVTVPAEAPIGSFFGFLSFTLDNGWALQHTKEASAWRQTTLPCKGLIRGSVIASPQAAVFGPITAAGEDREVREIRLLPLNKEALQGIKVRTDNKALETAIASGPGNEKLLRITLQRKRFAAELGTAKPQTPPLSGQRLLHVFLTLRSNERLVVPVQIPFESISTKKN